MTGVLQPLIPPLGRPGPASLEEAVLAGLARLLPPEDPLAARLRGLCHPGLPPAALFEAALTGRAGADAPLLAAARGLGLSTAEIAATALLAALERDPAVPAALRAIQGRDFGPWPSLATLGCLLVHLGQQEPDRPALPQLGRAFALGLIQRVGPRMPGPEDCLSLSPAVALALGLPLAEAPVAALPRPAAAPPGWQAAARAAVARLSGPVCLVLRAGDAGDRRLFAALLADALGLRAVALGAPPPGFGAAARIAGWLPVEEVVPAPGTRLRLASLPGHDGPRVVLAGREGGILVDRADCCDLALPPFEAPERTLLWEALLPGSGAGALHGTTRIGPARLAAVAARARAAADRPLPARLRAAMGEDCRPDMEPHAQLVAADIDDAAFVTDGSLRADLDMLLARCRFRATAPASPVRGVRALLSGPSGTGKTLAASWLATRLGLPLFRLDLSSVVSKWIGETEENLARVLDRAESADMVLLMDEADSLFGARTETRDSSDRFANNQTNFLLSRIEAFDGICLLTTNAAERVDFGFVRRLDQLIEVPLPAARERRRIWQVHLGPGHGLDPAEINRLAGLIDLAGGHIRNIVQSARVLAADRGRPIGADEVARGIALEYRKLGRTPPRGLET